MSHHGSSCEDFYKMGYYWVVPGRLLAGCHPGPGSLYGSTSKLCRLIDSGISCFLDLTADGEVPGYAELADKLAAEVGRSAIYHLHHPMVEHGTPDSAQVRETLDDLDAALGEKLLPLVHCHYGVGRTGVIVACWLMRHRIACGNNVLGYIDHLRAGLGSPWSSPNTPSQRRWVSQWTP